MKEQKICHIINLDTIGGVEQLFSHFIALSKSQENLQHHAFVTGEKIHPKLSSYLTTLTSLNYEKFIFGLKIPKWLSWLRKQQKIRSLRSQKFDRVILWNRFDDIELIKKEVGPDCKVIYYEHGASWIKSSDKLDHFFSHVDHLFVNSYAAKRVCELKWNVEKPIYLIENPLRPDISIIEKERDGLRNNPTIGFIGRLIPLKGVSLLLHAFSSLLKRYPSLNLRIAGIGQEMVQLQKVSSLLSIQKNVQFVGEVSDVSSFYDQIDLLVIPSIREPLGLVALEAQARGCPVIATYIDGLPEAQGNKNLSISPTISSSQYTTFGGSQKNLPDLVYEPKKDSLIQPLLLNPQDIVDKVENILTNPQEYSKLSREAVLFARNWQNFDQYVAKLSNFMTI